MSDTPPDLPGRRPSSAVAVAALALALAALIAGLGFAWYPELRIRDELADGRLRPLPLAEGRHRYATLYRVFARPEFPGPACRELADILERLTREQAGDAAIPE